MKVLFFIIFFSFLGLGCQTQSIKKSVEPEKELTALQHFNIGNTIYKTSLEKNDVAKFFNAIVHYKAAYDLRPYNVTYQYTYYLALFTAFLSTKQSPNFEIKNLYTELNPLIKRKLNPPEYIDYLLKHSTEEKLSKRANELLKVISVQPESASLWLKLSYIYTELGLHWMAHASINIASKLHKDNVEISLQNAYSLKDIADSQACKYDEFELNKKAAVSLAKISRKTEKEIKKEVVFHDLAIQYIRLGLFPLAFQNATKAYELNQEDWVILTYIDSAILANEFEAAKNAIKAYQREDFDMNGLYEHAAILAINEDRNHQAVKDLINLRNKNKNILIRLRINWITELIGRKKQSFDLKNLTSSTLWEDQIYRYAVSESKTDQSILHDFISTADNGCEKTEAYFYAAYWSWQNKNVKKAKFYLNKVKEQSATLYLEYLWADAISEML